LNASPWGRSQASIVGQLVEWEVWVELVVQSHGRLHVFLPLLDRGVDALVHRLDDGRWIPVQVKGRSKLRNGSLEFTVPLVAMVDPKAMFIGVALEDDHLGPRVLVISERAFRRVAVHSEVQGRPVVFAQVSLVPGRRSRWARYVFAREQLAEALIAGVKPTVSVPLPLRRQGKAARVLGFRGEVEVLRRLADQDELSTYRAFPDLETAEIAVIHEETRRVLGIQVKTIGVDRRHLHDTVDIDMASFRPSDTTWVVVAAWDREQLRFKDECLVIPSTEVDRIVEPYRGHVRFPFMPGSDRPGRLDPYRRLLTNLGRIVADLCIQSPQGHR
jgi:hypothetical protein